MAKRTRKAKPDESTAQSTSSVFPMQLQVGDRFTDETGDWEIATQPYAIVGGKTFRARVRRVGEPAVTEERTWSAYEKVAVKRG